MQSFVGYPISSIRLTTSVKKLSKQIAMEGLIPYIIGAISRKQNCNDRLVMKHSDSSKCLLLGSANNSFNGSFRTRVGGSGSHHLQDTAPRVVTANNNQLRNRKH